MHLYRNDDTMAKLNVEETQEWRKADYCGHPVVAGSQIWRKDNYGGNLTFAEMVPALIGFHLHTTR